MISEKKEAFHQLWVSSRTTKKLHYSGPNNGKSFATSAPQSRWGRLFSFLEQKSASKALKTCYFAYFSGYSPPAPLATLLCPCHNNIMQFLEVSKTVKWLDSSPPRFGKKSYFNFALNVFFKKELKGAILFQNHRRSYGGGPGGPGPFNQNATNDKNLTKKSCFFIFSFF